MSSIVNRTTGEVEIADPLAIAYIDSITGLDVPVTDALPLPITGTITTTQGPVQYVDAGGTDVEVKEGVRPLPVSVEASVDVPMGPIEFKNAGGTDTVVQAGALLTALPIAAEGGTIDTVTDVTTVATVSTVTSVSDVVNVQSVDTVDTVASVTDVVNVQSVDLVDSVTAVDQSNSFHQNGVGAWVANALDANRNPVTERGISLSSTATKAIDVGPTAGIGVGAGVVFFTSPGWSRINHVGAMNNSPGGDFSIGIVDGITGDITYSGEMRIMGGSTLPGAAAITPREYSQPFILGPSDQLAVWHSVPGSAVDMCFTAETLE